MPSTDNTGLWSNIFRVPPNPIFGQPIQFSCPIDAFVALDSNMDMRGVSIKITMYQCECGKISI